jgi:hypothetical protein
MEVSLVEPASALGVRASAVRGSGDQREAMQDLLQVDNLPGAVRRDGRREQLQHVGVAVAGERGDGHRVIPRIPEPLLPLRPETKGQAEACPDRMRATPCTVRAAGSQLPGATVDDVRHRWRSSRFSPGQQAAHSRGARYVLSSSRIRAR